MFRLVRATWDRVVILEHHIVRYLVELDNDRLSPTLKIRRIRDVIEQHLDAED